MDETILLSYLKGETSKEDCLLIETWSEASPENRKVLEQLYYILFIGDRLEAMEQVDVEASLAKLKSDIRRKANNGQVSNRQKSVSEPTGNLSESIKQENNDPRWRMRYAVVVAAFLIGIVFTGAIVWGLSESKAKYTFLTEKGERAQILLPDGTRVWLNSSTHLSYQPSFFGFNRKLDLTGEAYFEVAPDKYKQFVVNTNNIKTRVLGTKFNIRARDNEQRVVTTLLEGLVRVDIAIPGKKDKEVLIKPGQELSINTQTYNSKLVESLRPDDILLWIKGKLNFNNSTLLNITNSLEKHFDVQFSFDNEDLKHKRFTAEFETDDDITQILTVLSLTNQVNYKKEGRIVRLSD